MLLLKFPSIGDTWNTVLTGTYGTFDNCKWETWFNLGQKFSWRMWFGAVRDRSSKQRCSIQKGVLKNFSKFTGKRLCQSFFINKVTGLRPVTSLKKRLWHRCFLVNLAKFLRTPSLQNTSGRMLLQIPCFINLASKTSNLI